MKNIQRSLYTIIAVIFILSASCRKNPAGFTMPDDPRAYTWSVDTLTYTSHYIDWYTGVFNLWGSSAQNIYAVGHCTAAGGAMYRFDGAAWQPDKKIRNIKGYDLQTVFGFGSSDVWAGGGRSKGVYDPDELNEPNVWKDLIVHYNGSTWEDALISEPDTILKLVTSIWGSAPDDVWFGASWGNMYHWDGTTFTKDSLLFDINKYVSQQMLTTFHSMTGYLGKGVYAVLLGTKGDREYLVERKSDGWVFKDSLNSYLDIWMSPSGRLYVANFGGVYEWNGSGLTALVPDICAWAVYGTDDNHIFA